MDQASDNTRNWSLKIFSGVGRRSDSGRDFRRGNPRFARECWFGRGDHL